MKYHEMNAMKNGSDLCHAKAQVAGRNQLFGFLRLGALQCRLVHAQEIVLNALPWESMGIHGNPWESIAILGGSIGFMRHLEARVFLGSSNVANPLDDTFSDTELGNKWRGLKPLPI